MPKYDIRVGFSGHFFASYEVAASTEEAARELLEHAIQDDGWQEASVQENILALTDGHIDVIERLEITDWDIDSCEEATEPC